MDWQREIEAALAAAKVAILLISADFLASDFIANNELPKILEKAERGGCRIIPVILTPCLVKNLEPLSKFQSINPPERPLSKLKKAEQEEFLVKVAETFREQ